jgi:hypothetical protein
LRFYFYKLIPILLRREEVIGAKITELFFISPQDIVVAALALIPTLTRNLAACSIVLGETKRRAGIIGIVGW